MIIWQIKTKHKDMLVLNKRQFISWTKSSCGQRTNLWQLQSCLKGHHNYNVNVSQSDHISAQKTRLLVRFWWLSFLSTVNHVFPLQLRPLICMAVSSTEIMKQIRPNILLLELEMGFPCGSDYKESSCNYNAGNLDWEDPLEKGMASHSSILAWRISWTQKPGRLQSTRSQSQTWLSDFHFFFTFFKVSKATTNADLLPQLVHRYEQVTLEILLFRFKGISKVKICCCSVIQSCLTLCNPMDCSTPDFPVLGYLPEFAQTHVHWVSDIIKLSQSLSPHSPLALNLSQHQGLFQWVISLDQVAKISELQLYHQSFQWICSVQFSCSVRSIPMNIQHWFPLELTGLISLLSKGLSSLFQHHSSKASILWCSAFFMVHLWMLSMCQSSSEWLGIQWRIKE